MRKWKLRCILVVLHAMYRQSVLPLLHVLHRVDMCVGCCHDTCSYSFGAQLGHKRAKGVSSCKKLPTTRRHTTRHHTQELNVVVFVAFSRDIPATAAIVDPHDVQPRPVQPGCWAACCTFIWSVSSWSPVWPASTLSEVNSWLDRCVNDVLDTLLSQVCPQHNWCDASN